MLKTLLRNVPPMPVWLRADGRLSRLQYLSSLIVLGIVGAALVVALEISLYPQIEIAHTTLSLLLDLGIFCLTIALTLLAFNLAAKRFHDLGLPGIISLAWILPNFIVGILAMASVHDIVPEWTRDIRDVLKTIAHDADLCFAGYLLLAPGEKGANRYGPDPLEPAP